MIPLGARAVASFAELQSLRAALAAEMHSSPGWRRSWQEPVMAAEEEAAMAEAEPPRRWQRRRRRRDKENAVQPSSPRQRRTVPGEQFTCAAWPLRCRPCHQVRGHWRERWRRRPPARLQCELRSTRNESKRKLEEAHRQLANARASCSRRARSSHASRAAGTALAATICVAMPARRQGGSRPTRSRGAWRASKGRWRRWRRRWNASGSVELTTCKSELRRQRGARGAKSASSPS